MAYDNRALRGVGGWLAFYVIVLSVIQPLRVSIEAFGTYNAPNAAAVFGDAWPTIQALELALNVLLILGGWFIAWRLVQRPVWQSVRIAIGGMWVLGLGFLTLDLLIISFLGNQPLPGVFESSGRLFLQPIISGTIWTAYFLRSERVANTYVKETGEEGLVEVFS